MTKPDIANQNRRRAASWAVFELGITIEDLCRFLVCPRAMKRLYQFSTSMTGVSDGQRAGVRHQTSRRGDVDSDPDCHAFERGSVPWVSPLCGARAETKRKCNTLSRPLPEFGLAAV